jgi:pilus assembly protein CpaE
VSEGGIRGAAAHFADHPTPGLLIVESDDRSEDGLLASLEALSEVCQPDTKVVVLGALNDVIVYRNLKRQGISEYLPVPVDAKAVVETVVGLFVEPGEEKLGRLVSFMGTSGGAGTSQLSHNVAYQLSRLFDAETAVVDLDLAYGTVGLDFNLDSPQSAAAVLAEPDRIDDAIVQRSMAKYNENLHILTGPQNLVATADVNPAATPPSSSPTSRRTGAPGRSTSSASRTRSCSSRRRVSRRCATRSGSPRCSTPSASTTRR